MSLALKYSLRAEGRLLEIGRHTEHHFGENQRRIYLKTLMSACESLREFPQLGKPRDALFFGLRSLAVEKHVVFYFEQNGQILIVDILHERMEPQLHLG